MSAVVLKQGGIVWIRCEVGQGMMPTEHSFTLHVSGEVERVVKGFVPQEDVKTQGQEGAVRAVVARVSNGDVALLFRGEIFGATNPVLVPTTWLKHEIQNARATRRSEALPA